MRQGPSLFVVIALAVVLGMCVDVVITYRHARARAAVCAAQIERVAPEHWHGGNHVTRLPENCP